MVWHATKKERLNPGEVGDKNRKRSTKKVIFELRLGGMAWGENNFLFSIEV